LVGKSEETRPLGRSRRKCEDKIKIYIKERGQEYVDWINLAQEWITVMKEIKEAHVA
jgi:hypothetical protein